MGSRRYFPRGKPESDCVRLAALWGYELEKAGLTGQVTVEHTPCEDPQDGVEVKSEHVYSAELPGTPWPMSAEVFTSSKGFITRVVYHTAFTKQVAGQLELKKPGTILRNVFEGEGAEALNANKELLKTLWRSISIKSQTTFSLYLLFYASYLLTPTDSGTDVTVTTAIHTPLLGWLGKSLGLSRILPALQDLEAAL